MLSTASLSILGYENGLARPAIRLWNDTHHLLADNVWDTYAESLLFTEVTK